MIPGNYSGSRVGNACGDAIRMGNRSHRTIRHDVDWIALVQREGAENYAGEKCCDNRKNHRALASWRLPQRTGNFNWIDAALLPPSLFVAGAVKGAVVDFDKAAP